MKYKKVLLLSLIIFFTGCTTVPLNHIGAFSKATAGLAETTAGSYEFINNSTVKRKISDIASDLTQSPDDDTFKKIITDSNLAVRIKLLKGVESYAKALGELASADFRKDIDEASKDLYGSLGNLQKTYSDATNMKLPLSDESFALIATAVDAIGVALAENKRRDAIKSIVINSDSSIQMTLKLVSKEMTDIQKFALANMNSIYVDKIKEYQTESKNLTREERVSKLNAIWKAYNIAQATSELFKNVIVSSEKIASAHAVLKNTVEADKFTSKALVTEIKELVTFSKTTKSFHDELLVEAQ